MSIMMREIYPTQGSVPNLIMAKVGQERALEVRPRDGKRRIPRRWTSCRDAVTLTPT